MSTVPIRIVVLLYLVGREDYSFDDHGQGALTALANRLGFRVSAINLSVKGLREERKVGVHHVHAKRIDSVFLEPAGVNEAKLLLGQGFQIDGVHVTPPEGYKTSSRRRAAKPTPSPAVSPQKQVDIPPDAKSPEVPAAEAKVLPPPAIRVRRRGSSLVRQERVLSKQLLASLRESEGVLYYTRGNRVLKVIAEDLGLELEEARRLIWHMVSDELIVQYVAWRCVYGIALSKKSDKLDHLADKMAPTRPSKSHRGSQIVIEDEDVIDADAVAPPADEFSDAA
jgi:hypothetical protein